MSGTPQGPHGAHGPHGQREFDGWTDGPFPGQYVDPQSEGFADGYADGYAQSYAQGVQDVQGYADGPAEGGYAEAYPGGYAPAAYGYEGYPQQVPTLPDDGQVARQYDGAFPQQYVPEYEQQQYQGVPEQYAGDTYAPYAPGGELVDAAAYGYRGPADLAQYPDAPGTAADERFDAFEGEFAEGGVRFEAGADFGDVAVLDDDVPFDGVDEVRESDYVDGTTATPDAGRERAGERAASRVPIWHPPGLVPAVLTAGLAGVLIAGALVGGAAMVAGVGVLQVVTAAGWFRLHGMWPARQGIALAILAGGAADAAVLLAGDDALGILPGILAAVLGVVLLQQLARRDGRPELLPALTVTASAALLTVLDVLFVLAARVESPDVRDGALVAVGAAAVAAAVLPAAMPLPGPLGAALGLAAASVTGLVAGSVLNLGGTAVVLGAGAGLMGLLGRRTAGYDHPSKFVHFTAGVSLPLALAAPAVYLLGRATLG
ncbi:hypothetical protein [Yinghuangia sp. YIM S09857]|uniref:hypothetical protein n=1 Tax=Yinghuangia sp. YIM S09857 TaxID=3436929 RepID=UPI003F53A860